MVEKCLLLDKVKIGKKEIENTKHGNNIFLLKMASVKCLLRNKEANGGEKQKRLPLTLENK